MTPSYFQDTLTEDPSAQQVRGLIYAFRCIAAPLLAAVMEVRALALEESPETRQEKDAAVFAQLLESAADLGKASAQDLGAGVQSTDDWIRCSMASAASTVIAAHYRATGKPVLPTTTTALVAAVQKATVVIGSNPPPGLTDIPLDEGLWRVQFLKTLGPVVGAVLRYAFGRDESILLGEIAERLQRSALEMTQQLLPNQSSVENKKLLLATVLEVMGHLYAESHYKEADRLIDMTPEERSAYLARNNNQIPITPVWDVFNRYTGMLLTLIQKLKIPDDNVLAELKVA